MASVSMTPCRILALVELASSSIDNVTNNGFASGLIVCACYAMILRLTETQQWQLPGLCSKLKPKLNCSE